MAKKTWTIEIVLGGIILLALAAIITISLQGDSDSSEEETGGAYAQGYYDYAYELLEDTWHDSRLAQIRATLIVNTCNSESDSHSCEFLKDERDSMAARQMPERITAGSEFDFDRAVIPIDSELRQLNASMRYLDHHIGRIEEAGIDNVIAAMIQETVAQAGRAKFAIIDADEHLANHPDDTEVREAQEALEAVLAQHETGNARSGWGLLDLEQAFDEIEEATTELNEALPAS